MPLTRPVPDINPDGRGAVNSKMVCDQLSMYEYGGLCYTLPVVNLMTQVAAASACVVLGLLYDASNHWLERFSTVD